MLLTLRHLKDDWPGKYGGRIYVLETAARTLHGAQVPSSALHNVSLLICSAFENERCKWRKNVEKDRRNDRRCQAGHSDILFADF